MAFKSSRFSVHARSRNHDWQTPPGIFKRLDDEFHFELDAAASAENALCDRFYTKEDDALLQPWAPATTFVNPPYGRLLPMFVEKASREAALGATIVMLIPARTDSEYWHDLIFPFAEVRFIRGRLGFHKNAPGKPGKGNDQAPFPTAIVIFRPPAADAAKSA